MGAGSKTLAEDGVWTCSGSPEDNRPKPVFREGQTKAVSLLPLNPFRIIHGLLEARRFRPVGSRPLFLLGESAFLEPDHGS